MLTKSHGRLARAPALLEARVQELVAEMTGASRGASLLEAPLDSLTLLAIVTRIEVAFAVSFEGDEIVALLGARDPMELASLVAAKVAGRQANLDEMAGNQSCAHGEKGP